MASPFEEAFANARQQGLDQFTFDGKAFTTELANSSTSLPSQQIRTVESDLSFNPSPVPVGNMVQPNINQSVGNSPVANMATGGNTAETVAKNTSSLSKGMGFLQDNAISIGAGLQMAGSAMQYGKTKDALEGAMDDIDNSIGELKTSIGKIGGKASEYTENVRDDASEMNQLDAVNQFASIENKDVGKSGQMRQKMIQVSENINNKLKNLAIVRQEKSKKAIDSIMAQAQGATSSLESNISSLEDEKKLMEEAIDNAKKNRNIDLLTGGATIAAGIIGGPGAAKAVNMIGRTAGDSFKSQNKYNV